MSKGKLKQRRRAVRALHSHTSHIIGALKTNENEMLRGVCLFILLVHPRLKTLSTPSKTAVLLPPHNSVLALPAQSLALQACSPLAPCFRPFSAC